MAKKRTKPAGLGDVGIRPLRPDDPAVLATKPSEETEEVRAFLAAKNQAAWADLGIPRANDVLINHLAAELVRRYPGLTRKPAVGGAT